MRAGPAPTVVFGAGIAVVAVGRERACLGAAAAAVTRAGGVRHAGIRKGPHGERGLEHALAPVRALHTESVAASITFPP